MELPVNPTVLPMLAQRVSELPSSGEWLFEPKWDGFRVLVFRDREELLLQSRDEKPLNRYFPELLEALARALPERVALDGEIVIARAGVLDFDALQLRVHPAASRVKLLASQRRPRSAPPALPRAPRRAGTPARCSARSDPHHAHDQRSGAGQRLVPAF